MDADSIIALLDLSPHPEGGWFREVWRASAAPGERPAGTSIYFLLAAGERSHWHRIDAAETWHHYSGAPLELTTSATDSGPVTTSVLGADLGAGQRPQQTVPAGHWQAARTLGAHTLVGCTVSPGFDFAGFTLAPPGWAPGA